MRQVARIVISLLLLAASLALFSSAFASPAQESQPESQQPAETAEVDSEEVDSAEDDSQAEQPEAALADAQVSSQRLGRGAKLVGSLTIFVLAIFVGFEVITKVPPTLHTPLMSGSNAISGITVVGALLAAGHAIGGFGSLLGMLALVLASINVIGGFLVTHRMLMMFKKR